MGLLYTATSVSSYNANPPPDDGSTVATNLITWAGIKSKLTDPLNVFDSSIDANVTAAFAKTLDGSSVVSTAVNYPVGAVDQGRLIIATAPGITITTPDATSVGNPFVFAVSNQSGGGLTLAGFGGTQTVDGSSSQSIPNGTGAIIKTNGANWFSVSGMANATVGVKPQGYLTLNNDVNGIITNADITASTNVYYSPYVGNTIPIYNGTAFINYQFGQMTLALSASHTSNTLYDVFMFLNPSGGAVTIGTGPAWANSGAGTCDRSTGAGTTQVGRVGGIWTNAQSITARNGATTYTVIQARATYVGTIFIDSVAGQISCHVSWGQSRKWGVWNAYNRLPIAVQCGDSTASWNYAATTVRAAHNTAANSITVLQGLAEENMDLVYEIKATIAANAVGALENAQAAIGWNVTNAVSGFQGDMAFANPAATACIVGGHSKARYFPTPSIGINTVTACESGNAAGSTITWFGTQPHMLLSAKWNG